MGIDGVYQSDMSKRPYTLLDKTNVLKRQRQMIEEVQDESGLSDTLARSLLIKYRWNAQAVKDAFANVDDLVPTTFKFEIQTADNKGASKMSSSINNEEMADEELFLCESCYCEYEEPEVITMPDCAHKLCSYCFQAYLEMKLG